MCREVVRGDGPPRRLLDRLQKPYLGHPLTVKVAADRLPSGADQAGERRRRHLLPKQIGFQAHGDMLVQYQNLCQASFANATVSPWFNFFACAATRTAPYW